MSYSSNNFAEVHVSNILQKCAMASFLVIQRIIVLDANSLLFVTKIAFYGNASDAKYLFITGFVKRSLL